MSQSLEFKITASDQASRVVAEVQRKVVNFGKDIVRSIVVMAGPLALMQMAFSKISQSMEEMKQKAKDAFDWGSGLSASAGRMGVTIEEFQRLQSIAERTGEPMERVVKAFKEAGRVLAEAKSGNKGYIQSLEALGFSIEDIENLKAEDIIIALGDALATIESPAEKAAAAFAVFGTEGEKLVETLERIRTLTKNPQSNVLSDEQARFLAQFAQQQKDQADLEKLKLARQQATELFLATPRGQEIVAAERARERRQTPMGAGMPGAGALSASGFLSEEVISKRQDVQDLVQKILAEQFKAEDEAAKPTPRSRTVGRNLVDLGLSLKEKPKPAVKEEVVKAATLTVSSLRSIGGGMAGEMTAAEEMAREALEYARRTAEALEQIANSGRPITDFTKPVPEGLSSPTGRGGVVS